MLKVRKLGQVIEKLGQVIENGKDKSKKMGKDRKLEKLGCHRKIWTNY